MLKALILSLVFLPSCDGTLSGIGRTPRPPESPLPKAPVETAAPRNTQTEIAAQHLLIMFTGSKSAPAGLSRTKEQARAIAEQALARIKKGEDFGKVVEAYTEEPGGKTREGSLGRFTRETMVRPFSEAAFALQIGQVSPIVETPFGYHIIRRTE